MERKAVRLLEAKATGAAGRFSGYGAVFGNVDSYGDIIEPGAFTDSLAEWTAKGRLPKMLLQHGGFGLSATDLLPIGQWRTMREDSQGLFVEGQLFAMQTETGQRIYEALHSGALDGLSIGFQTIDDAPGMRDGEPVRYLTAIDLWEVSLVTFPANDRAVVEMVKGFTRADWASYRRALTDDGFSETDSFDVLRALRRFVSER